MEIKLTEKQKQAIETVIDLVDNMDCYQETGVPCDSCPWLRYCRWGDDPRDYIKRKLNVLLKQVLTDNRTSVIIQTVKER